MRISNKYIVYWDSVTKVIQNDYTKVIPEDANYDFANGIDFYASDSISAIEDKITVLGLKPMIGEEAGAVVEIKSAIQSRMGEWAIPERTIRAGFSDETVINLAKDYPELLVRIKGDGVPVELQDGLVIAYFLELLPEHKQLIESYGAVVEEKA